MRHLQRRRLLQGLSCALGSSVALGGADLSLGALISEFPATEKEKVAGIGGFFFRAKDPVALGRWYQEHLGISLAPKSYDDPVWLEEAGPTVFEAQPENSDLFGDAHKNWMMNFRVRDLDKMAAQLRAAGIKVEVDPQTYPNGRFAHLHDPERNPIDLWQAKKPDASR